jgi:hypothetical protein
LNVQRRSVICIQRSDVLITGLEEAVYQEEEEEEGPSAGFVRSEEEEAR